MFSDGSTKIWRIDDGDAHVGRDRSGKLGHTISRQDTFMLAPVSHFELIAYTVRARDIRLFILSHRE